VSIITSGTSTVLVLCREGTKALRTADTHFARPMLMLDRRTIIFEKARANTEPSTVLYGTTKATQDNDPRQQAKAAHSSDFDDRRVAKRSADEESRDTGVRHFFIFGSQLQRHACHYCTGEERMYALMQLPRWDANTKELSSDELHMESI
jgi:hypothetical protein